MGKADNKSGDILLPALVGGMANIGGAAQFIMFLAGVAQTLAVYGLEKTGKYQLANELRTGEARKTQQALTKALNQSVDEFVSQEQDERLKQLFSDGNSPLQLKDELWYSLGKQMLAQPATMNQFAPTFTAQLKRLLPALDEQRVSDATTRFLVILLSKLCVQPELGELRSVQIYINARETNIKLDTLLACHDIANQPSRFINLTPDYIYTHPAPPKEEHIWLPTATPQWWHFRPELAQPEHADRDLYPILWRRITELPTQSEYDRNGGGYLQLLLAESGCGKTSLLMKLAVDLCQQEGSSVLYLWREASRSDDPIRLAARVLGVAVELGVGKRLYVLIDSILLLPDLPTFLTMLGSHQQPHARIVVIGASQLRHKHDPLINMDAVSQAMPDLGAVDQQTSGADTILYLKPYSDAELHRLALMLDSYKVLVAELEPVIAISGQQNVHQSWVRIFIQQALKLRDHKVLYQPRQATSLLTNGEYLADVIAKELTELQDGKDFYLPRRCKPLVSIYADVCLLYRLGIAMPLEWLQALAVDNPNREDAMQELAQSDLEISDIMVREGDEWRAKHELDAEEVCKLVFKGGLADEYSRLLAVVPLESKTQAMLMLINLLGDKDAAGAEARRALVGRLLADHRAKVAELIAAANCRELGTGWHIIYERLDEVKEAMRLAMLAIARGGSRSDVAAAYNNRGMAYTYQGKFEQAIADLDEAIRLQPNYPDAYGNRGNAYTNQGQLVQAFTDYNQALILRPNDPATYNNRGNAYFHKRNLNLAISDFDQALHLRPNYPAAYNNRGMTYTYQGKFEQAIADLDEAIRLQPNYPDAYGNRGNAYANQGQLVQAIDDYNQVLILRPSDPATYNNRGSAYLAKGELGPAIADFTYAITLQPNFPKAFYNLSCTYALKHEPASALDNLRRAITLDSDIKDVAKNNLAFDWLLTNDSAFAAEFRKLVGDEQPPV